MVRRTATGIKKTWIIQSLTVFILCWVTCVPCRSGRSEADVSENAFTSETDIILSETNNSFNTHQTLQTGSRGDEVISLQKRLTELGYQPGTVDGIFGEGTRTALIAFQVCNGLDSDGIAGPETLTCLFSSEAIAAPEPVNVLAAEWPLLVNRDHLLDATFIPANLVLLSEICDEDLVRIKYRGTRGVREAAEALSEMLKAARREGLKKWQISAGYRSWKDQEQILNNKISSYLKKNSSWSRKRARSAALRTVAEPGASEHHLGLAFDVNVPGTSAFSGTRQCTWLHKNCWDYGFIIRYQKEKEAITGFSAEAWHIRYVGRNHALNIRDLNLCLEEYLEMAARGELEVTEFVELDD